MNDLLSLDTWEQRVEYAKVKAWGRDFNLSHKGKSAQDILDSAREE